MELGLKVLLEVFDERSLSEENPAVRKVLSWDVTTWRSVLHELPLDGSTFLAQFEVSWDEVIEALTGWRRQLVPRGDRPGERHARLLGFSGLFLLTLVSLQHSERLRAPQQERAVDAVGIDLPHRPDSENCRRICQALVAEPEVRDALREVYAPDGNDDERADRVWESIDFSVLTFHRHGTTSFILRGRSRHEEDMEELALKFILIPFLRIPAIRNAAKTYNRDYRLSQDEKHLVRVRASTGSWIVMTFVDGETLDDMLQREPFSDGLRLDLMERFGKQLFLALAEMERCGFEHRDLSPSNIIVVERDDHEELHLIDLGVNSLYVHQMPGREAPDAIYVAPEVRTRAGRGRNRTGRQGPPDPEGTSLRPHNDLYSLGQLLIVLGCGRHEADGIIPDILYAQAPLIARFVEDLIDQNPDRRLIVFDVEPTTDSVYATLRTYFEEEINAVREARKEGLPTGRRDLVRGGRDAFLPVSGVVARQYRLWRARRRQHLYRKHGGSLGLRWILLGASASAVVGAVTSLLILTWVAREIGVDLPGAALGSVPFPTWWRAPDYGFASGAGPVALGILMLSFLLVGVKYYQTLFGNLTFMVTGRRQGWLTLHAAGTDVVARLWTVLPIVLAAPVCLVQPRWWPLVPAVGMTFALLSNALSYTFTGAALNQARAAGLSVADPAALIGRRNHGSWATGNVFHGAGLWAVGLLLLNGVATDALAFIILLVAWNVQLYITREVQQGANIRAGLARACAAAERLRCLRDSSPAGLAHPVPVVSGTVAATGETAPEAARFTRRRDGGGRPRSRGGR